MKRTLSLGGYLATVLLGVALIGIAVGVTTHNIHAQTTTDTLTIEESEEDRQEILWLARAIYSETKDPFEQALVAWVVRNRVETGFYGSTYKSVVLYPKQFSGLNASDHNYNHNISRSYESHGETWKNALVIARAVYYADEALRPIPQTVRHFYSPISMKNGATPKWAIGKKAIHTITDTKTSGVRFAFYDGIQ